MVISVQLCVLLLFASNHIDVEEPPPPLQEKTLKTVVGKSKLLAHVEIGTTDVVIVPYGK